MEIPRPQSDKDKQQSLMSHWRVKMNPRTVQPLPVEDAPEKFNPKARRSSAPANMQIRFKIDKRKPPNIPPLATSQEFTSMEGSELNPKILISAPPDR